MQHTRDAWASPRSVLVPSSSWVIYPAEKKKYSFVPVITSLAKYACRKVCINASPLLLIPEQSHLERDPSYL